MKLNKLIAVLTLAITAGVANADTKYIHKWSVDGSAGWRTDINVANVCQNTSVDVEIQLWKSNGTQLANKQISSGYATDSEGKIAFTLAPHESKDVNFAFTHFSSFTTGNGKVTTTTSNPDAACLVGGYQYHTTVGGNNYGHALSYQFNNGEKF